MADINKRWYFVTPECPRCAIQIDPSGVRRAIAKVAGKNKRARAKALRRLTRRIGRCSAPAVDRWEMSAALREACKC
jgi:hypothetical protein